MKLERYCYAPDHVRGRLHVTDSLVLETIERPWLDNRTYVSCIPDGTYTLEKHVSDRYKGTVALVNPELDVHHWDQGHGRSVCLIHSANFAHQVQGCIAVGMTAGVLYSKGKQTYLPAVLNSRKAMDLLRPHLRPGSTLEIKPVTGTSDPEEVRLDWSMTA